MPTPHLLLMTFASFSGAENFGWAFTLGAFHRRSPLPFELPRVLSVQLIDFPY